MRERERTLLNIGHNSGMQKLANEITTPFNGYEIFVRLSLCI